MLARNFRALTGNALPAEVAGILEAAHCTAREGGDEGPRVMVVMAGGGLRGAWIHDRATTEARIRRRWPELTAAQLKRAADLIEAKAMQAARLDKPQAKRRGWVFDY